MAGYEGQMLGSLAVAWAVLQLGRFILSPLLPAIIADLGVTTVAAGVALGAFQAVYAVVQYPSGRYSDRLSRATLIVPGFVVLVGAFVALSVATTYALFFAAVLALGVGKGLFTVPSRALLSDLFVERRGQALGVYSAGTDVGGILASVGAIVVTGTATAALGPVGTLVPTVPGLDWRSPFVPIAAVLAVAGVVYVLLNRDPYAVGRPSMGVVATLRRLATTREQREGLVAFSLFFFVVGGFVNFLPTYLARGKGIEEGLAAALFALVFVVGVAAKPLAGLVADRVPRRVVGVGGLLLAVAALVGLVRVESVPAVAAAIALLALGYKALFPVVDALVLDAAPAGNAGGDLGAARALFLGVGALGPVYVGWVAAVPVYRLSLAGRQAAVGGYQLAFLGLGACLLVAAALLGRGVRGRE